MEVLKEEPRQPIEPEFLSQAQTNGIKLRIGQMNRTEHEGIVRDIGRYEINFEENGRIVTLLKQEISSITAPQPILTVHPPQQGPVAPDQTEVNSAPARPNIQQEFLDKAVREGQLHTLYLINGLRMKATIEGYDSFTILVKEGGRQHLYYKHSITTINR
ncbi:MAG TPA: RNA chaperone Hfq [Nitrospirota bacterium]